MKRRAFLLICVGKIVILMLYILLNYGICSYNGIGIRDLVPGNATRTERLTVFTYLKNFSRIHFM